MVWSEEYHSIASFEQLSNATNEHQKLLGGVSILETMPPGPYLLGVDEAGRGPVLGPMVYGIAFCPISESGILTDLGCADSKTLTEDNRETIFGKMLKEENVINKVGFAVDIISPTYISNCMLQRTKCSLNEVSMNSAIQLIKDAAEAGVDIAEVYVDTVGPAEKYQAKLSQIFPKFKITVAKKADSTYPIVSAASIAAKVTRDHALKHWKFIEGFNFVQKDFGSGYPGDPATKKFIKNQIDPVFGYPQLVRFSWSTAELALKDSAYQCIWDDDDEIVEKRKNASNKKISSFFSPKQESSVKKVKTRHKFFVERQLTLTEDF